MSELVAALIGGGAAIIVSIFGARDWLTRRSSKEANSTASWTALTGALQSDLTRLRGDVAMLHEDRDQRKLDLNHERHDRRGHVERGGGAADKGRDGRGNVRHNHAGHCGGWG